MNCKKNNHHQKNYKNREKVEKMIEEKEFTLSIFGN